MPEGIAAGPMVGGGGGGGGKDCCQLQKLIPAYADFPTVLTWASLECTVAGRGVDI